MGNLNGVASYQTFVRGLQTTDPGAPATWDPIHQVLINNDVYLHDELLTNIPSGVVGTPSVAAAAYPTTGLYWEAGPQLSVTVNGGRVAQFQATEILMSVPLVLGPSALPPFSMFCASSDSGAQCIASYCSADAGSAAFTGRKARGTHAAPTDVLSGDAVVAFLGSSYSGGTYHPGGGMIVRCAAAYTDGNTPPTLLELRTNPEAGGSVVALKIDQAQMIYMGSRVAAASPGAFAANYLLHFKDLAGNDFYLPAMAAGW
jgi:hypothetical protein